MKNIIFIIAVSLFLHSCNIKYKAYEGVNYRVTKIDSIENTYLVYAEKVDVSIKNTNVIKIASAKTDTNCKRKNLIKVDKNYKFSIFSLYPKNLVSHHLKGIVYNGSLILFDNDYNVKKDLFTTENLKGLCYKN